ncbi:MAG: hypothetical protein JWR87_2813 [Segetibacter sp.]|jgi:hypothetical protein|nr:hypothetical protein [Segetibacter sp.]
MRHGCVALLYFKNRNDQNFLKKRTSIPYIINSRIRNKSTSVRRNDAGLKTSGRLQKINKKNLISK